jgi:hypothetical protein
VEEEGGEVEMGDEAGISDFVSVGLTSATTGAFVTSGFALGIPQMVSRRFPLLPSTRARLAALLFSSKRSLLSSSCELIEKVENVRKATQCRLQKKNDKEKEERAEDENETG